MIFLKKFLLIIIAIFMLCSCNAETPEQSEIPKQEEQVSSEEKVPEEQPSKEELKIIREIEKEFSLEEMFYDERRTKFEELGLEVSVSNIEIIDEKNWTATINLKREEFELPIDILGFRTNFVTDNSNWSDYYWGTFIFTGNTTIAFCGKEKVLFFDERNLEPMDVDFEFPEKIEGATWVNGAAYVPEKEAYYLFTSAVLEDSADKYAFVSKHDLDGKIIEERKTRVPSSYEYNGEFYPLFMDKAVLFEFEGKDFVNTGDNFCGIGNEKTYQIEKVTAAENEYYDVIEIYNFYNYDYGMDYRDGNNIAFLSSCGNLMNHFSFVENNISTVYNIEDEISLFGSDDFYVYYSDYFAMSLELDFENKTHKLRYNPTDKHTGGGTIGTKSPDGKYTVCGFGETSGGDAMYWHVAIRNNETGKYVYVGRRGGMWGGSGENGFFKNGDFYTWNSSELTVIDPETGKVKFNLSDNFDLGYDEKTDSGRGILTFRRDPNDMTFIVVYYEYENGFEWRDVEPTFPGQTSHVEGNCNYKIGFLDAEGNLINSYDTGVPLWGEHVWGLHSVDMFYSEESLTLTVKNVGKGNSGFIGVFDMETNEFEIGPLR